MKGEFEKENSIGEDKSVYAFYSSIVTPKIAETTVAKTFAIRNSAETYNEHVGLNNFPKECNL